MIHLRMQIRTSRLVLLMVAMWATFAWAQNESASAPQQQANSFGSSGGNVNDSISGKCCSGTLGALLFAGSKRYILSANHVIGMLGKAQVGDAISQPGLIDNQCNIPRTVGKFTLASPISDNVDAAIAELVTGTMDSTGAVFGFGVPSSQIASPAAGMKVMKSGRSTGITHGTIQSYATNLKVDYSGGCKSTTPSIIRFSNQIVIVGDSATFAASADSGSLILTEDKRPVGLLIAGSDTLTVANPIGAVVGSLSKRLGATLAFQAGPGVEAFSGVFEQSVPVKKALLAKQTLFQRLLSEPSVLGVGVAGSTTEGAPELIVYIQEDLPAPKMESAGITVNAFGGEEFQGTGTRIVKTGPILAFGWNEAALSTKECSH